MLISCTLILNLAIMEAATDDDLINILKDYLSCHTTGINDLDALGNFLANENEFRRFPSEYAINEHKKNLLGWFDRYFRQRIQFKSIGINKTSKVLYFECRNRKEHSLPDKEKEMKASSCIIIFGAAARTNSEYVKYNFSCGCVNENFRGIDIDSQQVKRLRLIENNNRAQETPNFYMVEPNIYMMPYDIPRSVSQKTLVGEGTFGIVYEMFGGYSKPGPKALKLYKPMKQQFEKRVFLLETNVYLKLRNLEDSKLFIINHYGSFVNPDFSRTPCFRFHYMMITDYCMDRDLESFLQSHDLRKDQKMDLILKLSEAIHWFHRFAGLMHRDIKPKNILIVVSGDGVISPRLNDFGSVCAVNFDFKPSEWKVKVSTKEFESIEQIWNSKYTFKVDYWAMGLVFEIIIFATRQRTTMTKDMESCWLESYGTSGEPKRLEDWISYSPSDTTNIYSFEHVLRSHLLCLESEERSMDNFVTHFRSIDI